MLNVTLSRSAEIQFSYMEEEEKEKVRKWCEKLKNWKPGKWPGRVNLLPLGGSETVYHLKTDSSLRLFFQLDSQKENLTINDIYFRNPSDQSAQSLKTVGA
jgi:mRNA-degrading endonuclease RelE of RelBE toxin-antitoxin system